jgi:hypothetical protein
VYASTEASGILHVEEVDVEIVHPMALAKVLQRGALAEGNRNEPATIWRNQVSVDCEEPVFLCLREDPELPQLWTTDRTLNVVFRHLWLRECSEPVSSATQ